MSTAGRGEDWTGPQFAARVAALASGTPEPAEHIVCRITLRPDGGESTHYHVADEPSSLTEAELPEWLAQRRSAAGDRPATALLVIRETLDAAGQIRECALERRRGAIDGPLFGDPARVEFIGPARMVRFYRLSRSGGLLEVAATTETLLPRRTSHPFAGEQRALQQHFGMTVRVTDAREPTLFEEMIGLDSILRVHLPDGMGSSCGIGWHGPVPYVLQADFPRFAAPLMLVPDDESAVQELLARHDLVRHETRLDAQGLAVIGRRRGAEALCEMRPEAGRATMSPYLPAPETIASPDQERWLRFAETYERLAILDSWSDADSGDLLVVTGEASGQIWRHHIDRDGVENWRKPDDEAAAGLLYRERLVPGTLATLDATAAGPDRVEAEVDHDPEQAPADSLLAKIEAYHAALSALRAAQAATRGDPAQTITSILARLCALQPALEILGAEHTAAEVRRLLDDAEAQQLRPERLARVLARLEVRLRDDLGTTRLVTLPVALWRQPVGAAPFGTTVELALPQAAFDIDEAALCLAFRRPSAAAYHCMRIVECGLAALDGVWRTDGVGDGRDWSGIMARLRDAVGMDRSGLVAALTSVRRCWHGPNLLPVEKYTEAEAEHLFAAVGNFMRALTDFLPRDATDA